MNNRRRNHLYVAARLAMISLIFISILSMARNARANGLSDETITPTVLDTQTPVTPAPTDSATLPPAPTSEYTWLSSPGSAADLAADRPLNLLAGELIFHGLVDASSCPNNGLSNPASANSCGEKVAHNALVLWQNQYDAVLLDAAQKAGIPPFVLKNVIAQESQFWPASLPTVYGYPELGLGHITEMGADTLLRWNSRTAVNICAQVYGSDTCKTPYALMPAGQQATLRGMVVRSLDADCSNCAGGVDLKRANASIYTIAGAIRANYNYVDWRIRLATGKSTSSVVDNTDHWRLALASYNAGPGCVSTAIKRAQWTLTDLNWKNISAQFDAGCRGAVDYIHDVSILYPASAQILSVAADDTSPAALIAKSSSGWVGVTPTPEATATPVETITPIASTTPEASASPTESITPESSVTPVDSTTLEATPTSTELTAPETSVTAVDSTTPEATPTSPELTTPETSATPVDSITPEATPSPFESVEPDATSTPTIIATPEQSAAPGYTPTSESTTTPTATLEPSPMPIFPPMSEQMNDQIVVKFGNYTPGFLENAVIALTGGTVEDRIDSLGLTVISVPDGQSDQVIASLQNNLLVDYAEPNYEVQAFFTPNDPGYPNQTYLADMQVPQAWDVTQGAGIVVGVIDTGVDVNHPDLSSNLWTNPGETGTDASGNDKRTNGVDDDGNGYVDDLHGWNMVAGNNIISDNQGHGTHLSGIIAAQMDNAEGIAGIAPQARIMAINALDESGHGTYTQVSEAIMYAVDNGAKIINLGFGGASDSTTLQSAIDYAAAHDVLVVAAAGNSGSSQSFYPAAYPGVISVAAVESSLTLAPFSNYGSDTSLVAPGVGISSTLPGGAYGQLSGTSMSSAQVSGVAALLASLPQFDTAAGIREALLGSALDLGVSGWDIYYGNGLVHAFDALNYIPGQIPTPTPSPTPDANVSPTPASTDTGVSIMTDAVNALITNYARTCSTNAASYTGALGGTGVPAIQVNNAYTGPISLGPGFNFWYMGTRYTQVYVSSNGWLSFNNPTGAGAGPSLTVNDLDNLNSGGNTIYNTNARPILAPLWDNLGGGAAGSVASYRTNGIAPNRTFTFEWWNYQWNNGNASRVSMRVVLHESSGVIDFLYFPNNNNAGNGASIGITGTANNSFLSASAINNCPPIWSSTVETTNLNTKLPQGRTYTFTPPIPNAPTMLAPSNVTTTSETLNWTDNSTNEDGFVIYTSTDGVNYSFVAQTAANATSYNATGLANSANNYWRIHSVSEGAISSAASLNTPSALTFSNVKTTSMTLNWTDNAANETGYLIYRSIDNNNFINIAQTSANTTSYNATGLTAGTTYSGGSSPSTPMRSALPFPAQEPPIHCRLSPSQPRRTTPHLQRMRS